jgi:hypothetical protein
MHTLARALEDEGYAVERTGEAGARTCVISHASRGERWEGTGADDAVAYDAALSKLFRRLLEAHAARAAPPPRAEPEPAAPPPPMPTGPRDLRAILADLQTVASRVEGGIPEAALMAPPLQKLHVLAWISRARALEHEAGRNRSASDATGAIARRLTTLCKTWWPGSVRALQLDATPERASREQGLPPATRWLEVAEAAEARLEQLIAEPPSDDGWRDTPVLSPPPDDGGREIAFAIRTIERLVAPIDTIPTNDPPKPLTTNDELQLEDAAARLRWSRPVAPDPERWGAALGRLRWLVAHKRGGQRLARLLEPSLVPRPTWATEAQAARSRLVALTAPPDGDRELLAWLLAVFDAVDGPTLATRLKTTTTVSGRAVAPLVLAITENDLPKNDRRMRRRLRQLHSLMTGGTGKVADAPAIAGEGAAAAAAAAPEPEDTTPRPTYDERIFAHVKTKLPTASALFVSNREDPMLRERLTKALGWEIEWSTAEPRRISAIASAIGRGKYKVVLSATGFQDHSTDISLARAASASNTLYVRVNRGRIAACARALARELGIRMDEAAPEEAVV